MRRRRRTKKSVIIFLLLVTLIIISAIYLIFSRSKTNDTENAVTNGEIANQEQNLEEEKKTSISLIMCGDYLIHSSVYKDAARYANNGYDFKPMITHIKEKVKGYDLAYYNQETILGGTELGLSDYPAFNSPYEAGDAMIDAGFNLVSLATNHTMDSGSKAVLNSRKYWDEHQDIFAVRKL